MADALATEIRLQWPGMNAPSTLLTVRYNRALTSTEIRMLADIVEQVEDFRDQVADEIARS